MEYAKLIEAQFNVGANSLQETNHQIEPRSSQISRVPIVEEEAVSLAREQQPVVSQPSTMGSEPTAYPQQLLIADEPHELVSNPPSSPFAAVLKAEQSPDPASLIHFSALSPTAGSDSKQSDFQCHHAVEPFPPAPIKDQRAVAASLSSETLDLDSIERVRSSGSEQLIIDGVEKGRKTLRAIEAALGEAKDASSEAKRYLAEITSLRDLVSKVRTVIGVLGHTGAGKSSLINAILDQDNLIITNCSRACTAVATEIAYNHDTDPAHSYRAEIEFISPEEWAAEVNVLLEELVDQEKRLSVEYNNSDSDAGVAYQKIKAVFPEITHAQIISNNKTGILTNDSSLTNILGKTKHLCYHTADELRTDVRKYVDSTERTGKGLKGTAMAYWPLVKAARIYVKSETLRTGAILVDLPGVQDANAARSAVAERYMAECSALWIVSPITRAVSDKAAKQLLGSSFRQQLTMDGNYCNITFICSKTDQMRVDEVMDQLDDDGKIAAKFQEKEVKAAQVEELRLRRNAHNEKKRRLERKEDELDDPDDSQEEKSKKRNQCTRGAVPGADACSERNCLKCLRADIKTMRHQSTALWRQMGIEQDRCKSLELEGQLMCIQARNDFSATAIRRDFADGIKETIAQAEALDQEAFPGALNQDLNKLANSLSVFCVSSECYQQLGSTKSCNTAILRGFSRPEDTQIPQLQKHAIQLGQIQIERARMLSLTGLARLARSLTLWASPTALNHNQSKLTMSPTDRVEMDCILDDLEESVQQAMAQCKKEALDDLRKTMKQKHTEPIKSKCNDACAKLPKAAEELHWKDGIEIPWNTYRALCRNQGCPRTKKAVELKVNFNNALFAPVKENIAVSWSNFFTVTLEEVRRRHVLRFVQELRVFVAMVQETSRLEELRPGSRALISDQANSQIDAIQLFDTLFTSIIKADQREASRMFEPCIAESMHEIYEECAKMRGRGVLLQMRNGMEEFVKNKRNSIMKTALKKVNQKLTGLRMSLEEACATAPNEVLTNFRLMRKLLTNDGSADDGNTNTPYEVMLAKKKVGELLRDMVETFDKLLIKEDLVMKEGN